MSEINITIEGGTSYRLHTAGKYCDRDIVVTAEGGGWDGNLTYTNAFKVAIGKNSFIGNRYIKNVNIPFCEYVDNGAFKDCKNLDTVYINASGVADTGEVEISGDSFTGSSIKTLEIKKVMRIGESAFAECNELQYANIIGRDRGVFLYMYCFARCKKLEKALVLNCSEIQDNAFLDCVNLEEITISEGTNADNYISVAFNGCSNLKVVRLRDGVWNINLLAFLDTPLMTGEGHIYVPTSTFEQYRAGYEEAINDIMPGFFDILFRKIEDYTVDGTVNGELDPNKI